MPGAVKIKKIPTEYHVPGKPLGRHIEHDPRSWEYQAAQASSPRDVVHVRHCGPFDQGSLGSCTGNAAAGALMTDPEWVPGRALTEKDAVAIYTLGTHKDEFDGLYPPDDTGSSGLGVARAMKEMGLIKSYRHAFGVDQAIRALSLRPVITGVPWYQGFDHPDPRGLVEISGSIRGGHETEVAELHLSPASYKALGFSEPVVGIWQSWGPTFGRHGLFYWSVATWDTLLQQEGDVMTLH